MEREIAQRRRPVASDKALLVMLHWRTGAPPWPSKWPATEVHSFAAAAYFDSCNCS